jgi:hypothetical protein
MKKLAFIAGMLMGIAPATQAQPYGGDRYDQHDYDRRVDESHRLVPLVAMDIHRKQTVDIGRQAGQFRALRLQAQRGAAYVDFVEVRYGNGEQQHFDVRRRIGREEIVDVPFGASRFVDAITVHGRPDRWSQIQVLGVR